jgi:protein-L-isoaspartate(D-aspartate) O-methyltransferase
MDANEADSGQAKEERIRAHRIFFANLVTANAGIPPGSEIAAAFASTPREKFVGPPPWKIFTPVGYVETFSDDPALLYQDVVVSLGSKGPLNNGQPTLHAYCLATLALKEGERLIHVGAGAGYYTALVAKLVGGTGAVDAYEVEPDLAHRASDNLTEFSNVTVHSHSGAEGPLPECDVIYVNAGATDPMAVWLDALRPNGRLLFPLTSGSGSGAMLLVTKHEGAFAARFLVQAQFVPCIGARNEETAKKLAKAFRGTRWTRVKTLHRDNTPDDTCWFSGEGWWLSTN